MTVTEGNILVFIGWLAVLLERDRHQVGASAIKQYLRAIRQMQMLVTGVVVTPYLSFPKFYARTESVKKNIFRRWPFDMECTRESFRRFGI